MNIGFEDFNREVAAIFNNNGPNSVKYNLSCRLISKLFNASYVSILLYNSREDKMICKGNYIEPSDVDFTPKASVQDKEMIKYNCIIEFLITKKIPGPNKFNCLELYQQYQQSVFFEEELEESEFNIICQNFQTYFQRYRAFNRSIEKDAYSINDYSISGGYFKKLLALDGAFTREYYLAADLSGLSKSLRTYSELLENDFGILIDTDIYLGIPLYATERYFGVIRLMYSRLPAYIQRKDGGIVITDDTFKERLGNVSQLISLQLETSYYLDGYKKLTFNDNVINNSLESYCAICDTLTEVVNCNGVLIRVYDDDTKEVIVRGYSSTLKNYVDFLGKYKDPAYPDNHSFSFSLREMFAQDPMKIAISFAGYKPAEQEVIIYSFDEHNNIVSETRKVEMNDLRSKIYSDGLRRLSFDEITVIPIPGVVKGFMTFSNTRNRKFITADVEMITLAAKRIGLEIKHFYDHSRIKEEEHASATIDSMRNVIHQISTPLNGLRSHAANMRLENIPDQLLRERGKDIYWQAKHMANQLKRFQRLLLLEDPTIPIQKKTIISFTRYLINKVLEFRSYAKSRGIGVYVIPQPGIVPEFDFFDTDEDLLDEMLNNLIENAIKYSFTAGEMIRKNIAFDPYNSRTDGNILIYPRITPEVTEISISNWGLVIADSELEKVFERGYRSTSANDFTPTGSGIGLYLVKKMADALGAEVTVSNKPRYKTTFKLTFSKKVRQK